MDDSFAGEHQHVRDDLQGHAERDEHRTEEQDGHFCRVPFWNDAFKQRHRDIDEEREDERHGNLEQLDGIEPATKERDLSGEERHVDDERRLAERERIGKAQHVREARNRRRAEEALDDKRDAGRLHEDADGEDEIAFPDGQTKTSFRKKNETILS